MTFGEKILNFRAIHNLTQTELAEILGVGQNMIYRYEYEISEPTKANRIRFDQKLKEWESAR